MIRKIFLGNLSLIFLLKKYWKLKKQLRHNWDIIVSLLYILYSYGKFLFVEHIFFKHLQNIPFRLYLLLLYCSAVVLQYNIYVVIGKKKN